MKPVTSVIKELELGYVPTELSYGLEQAVEIDWTALTYNDWDFLDFWVAKQPSGLLEQFPCLMDWVVGQYESMKGKTPLDEMNERQGLLAKNITDN
jgi:hypothetical protein